MFWLKKFVSFWIMPVPLSLGLLVAGLLLSRRPRRQALGRRLAALAAALLVVLSNRLVSVRLIKPLENRYPGMPEFSDVSAVPSALAQCRFVVVLGSGHAEMPGVSATGRLSPAGLGRIVEGVRILRMLPNARLVVSGPGDPHHASHATVLAQAAQSLGITPERILLIDTARDTEDESFAVARVAGKAPVALITSAWHMPRAALLFRRAGVNFVACPADFAARGDTALNWGILAWDSDSLERSTRAVHEWLGLFWLRLRGIN